jgi:hypothetical protein
MMADLRGFLGEERWPALPSRSRTVNCEVLNRMLIPASKGGVGASVENDENGIPLAKWTWVGDVPIPGREPTPDEDEDEHADSENASGTPRVYSVNAVGYVNGSAALSSFLPGGNAMETTNITSRVGAYAPDAVRERISAWFQEQARARLSAKEKP